MEETKVNSFLETERIGKLMRKFSLPCIISLLVGALYNIVDQIFIANADYLGSFGNAANSVVFPLTVIALAIATMIGDGCGAFVSIRLGAKDFEKAHKSIGNSVLLTVASSIVLMVIYLIFADRIITAFGGTVNEGIFGADNESVYYTQFAIKAIRIILCATILSCVNKGVTIFLQSLGKAGTSTLLSVLREIVCGVGLVLLLPIRFGLDGLLWFMAIADIITFVASLAVLIHVDKSLQDS